MEQILLHRKQQFTLYALRMWKDEINVSIGRKLIAEEKIIHKRNQENIKFSWQEWKQNHNLRLRVRPGSVVLKIWRAHAWSGVRPLGIEPIVVLHQDGSYGCL